MIFEFVCAFSLTLATFLTRDYIKNAEKNPESKWTKFWNLYNNVQNEYIKRTN